MYENSPALSELLFNLIFIFLYIKLLLRALYLFLRRSSLQRFIAFYFRLLLMLLPLIINQEFFITVLK